MERDDYTKGAASFSVTELLMPPRIRMLRIKHDFEMVRDVSDSLWMLMGKAVHQVLQNGAIGGSIAEQRLFANFDGIKVSGALDLQILNPPHVAIKDFKFTSVWAMMSEKVEWEQQLNCYAQLVRMNGRIPESLHIVGILRDWSRAEAERSTKNYPVSPIQHLEIELWDEAKARAFIKERIALHTKAHFEFTMDEKQQSSLPECTKEERWEKEDEYAVMRPGLKRAMRVFPTFEEATNEANQYATKFAGIQVVHRPGEPVRCTRDYCGVSKWCEQYAKWRK